MTASATTSNHTRFSILFRFILKEEFQFSWAIITLCLERCHWERKFVRKPVSVITTNYHFRRFLFSLSAGHLAFSYSLLYMFCEFDHKKVFLTFCGILELKRLEATTIFRWFLTVSLLSFLSCSCLFTLFYLLPTSFFFLRIQTY